MKMLMMMLFWSCVCGRGWYASTHDAWNTRSTSDSGRTSVPRTPWERKGRGAAVSSIALTEETAVFASGQDTVVVSGVSTVNGTTMWSVPLVGASVTSTVDVVVSDDRVVVVAVLSDGLLFVSGIDAEQEVFTAAVNRLCPPHARGSVGLAMDPTRATGKVRLAGVFCGKLAVFEFDVQVASVENVVLVDLGIEVGAKPTVSFSQDGRYVVVKSDAPFSGDPNVNDVVFVVVDTVENAAMQPLWNITSLLWLPPAARVDAKEAFLATFYQPFIGKGTPSPSTIQFGRFNFGQRVASWNNATLPVQGWNNGRNWVIFCARMSLQMAGDEPRIVCSHNGGLGLDARLNLVWLTTHTGNTAALSDGSVIVGNAILDGKTGKQLKLAPSSLNSNAVIGQGFYVAGGYLKVAQVVF